MDYQRKIVYFYFFAASAFIMVVAAVAMYVLFAPTSPEHKTSVEETAQRRLDQQH